MSVRCPHRRNSRPVSCCKACPLLESKTASSRVVQHNHTDRSRAEPTGCQNWPSVTPVETGRILLAVRLKNQNCSGQAHKTTSGSHCQNICYNPFYPTCPKYMFLLYTFLYRLTHICRPNLFHMSCQLCSL